MEKLARAYAGKVEFLFIYCREAHPVGDRGNKTRTKKNEPIKQAMTLEERRATAQQFCDDMKSSRRILIDEFAHNSVQQLYGGRNNPAVVIDKDGRIALKQPWTNGDVLSKFLPEFLNNGGTFDLALAQKTPLPSAGGGGPGPGGDMMLERMVAKTLEGMTLTDAERKLAETTLRAKMQARGRLRQQLVELDQLAANKDINEGVLAEALKTYEAAVAEQQLRIAALERKLAEQVSPRARAQLLAVGVLDNGLGFIGPGGLRPGTGPMGPGAAPPKQKQP